MPVYFDSISFNWTLAIVAVLALIFAVRTFLGYRRLPQEASDDWDYQVSQNMQDLRLTKDAYVRAYKKVNAPRGALYIASTFSAILVLTPIAFAFINGILYSLWTASDEPIQIDIRGGGIRENIESLTYEPGNMVWGFFTFFGIIAIWALIAAFLARRYYRNAPGLMRDELIDERDGFYPDKPLIVGANPAHIVAWKTDDHESVPSRQTYATLFETELGLYREPDENYQGSGHACDTYSDGSEMRICVHTAHSEDAGFDRETHGFFYGNEFAREDDKEKIYTIISLLDDAHLAFEAIEKTGINMDKKAGSGRSRMRSFTHESLEFFLYNKTK